MKPLARILVPLVGDVGDEAALALAGEVARPFAAHISAVFFRIDPLSLPMAYTEPCSLGPVLAIIEDQENQAAQAGHNLFRDWCAREGVATEHDAEGVLASWCETVGGEQRQVAELGRLCDLTVVSGRKDASARCRLTFEAALFDTGRPVLLAPARTIHPALGSAVVAWNGSLEAARALSAALPMLAACKRVGIFTRHEHNKAPAKAEDAVAFLRGHQITAEVCPASADDRADVAEQLAQVCRAFQAGLLVMGAYARGRLREAVFGGVTRHMLGQDIESAVLMTH